MVWDYLKENPLFISSPVMFDSAATTHEAKYYRKYFIYSGKRHETSQNSKDVSHHSHFIKETRRATCLICDINMKAVTLQPCLTHIQSYHSELLHLSDISALMIEDVEEALLTASKLGLSRDYKVQNFDLRTRQGKKHNVIKKRSFSDAELPSTQGTLLAHATKRAKIEEVNKDGYFSTEFARAIIMGEYDLSEYNNRGMKHLLKIAFGMSNKKIPGGLSATNITRKVWSLHADAKVVLMAKLKVLVSSLTSLCGGDETSTDIKLLPIQQDAWSSKYKKDGFLGIIVTLMDIAGSSWKIDATVIGMVPFRGSHSAVKATELIKETLENVGLRTEQIFSCTSDTTPSSFNVFQNDDVHRFKCMAHNFNLLLKHSMKGEYAGNML